MSGEKADFEIGAKVLFSGDQSTARDGLPPPAERRGAVAREGFARQPEPASPETAPPKTGRPEEGKKRSNRRQRTIKVYFRVTPEEEQKILARAKTRKQGRAAYLRAAALGATEDQKLMLALMTALRKVGNNVNQITAKLHCRVQAQTGWLSAQQEIYLLVRFLEQFVKTKGKGYEFKTPDGAAVRCLEFDELFGKTAFRSAPPIYSEDGEVVQGVSVNNFHVIAFNKNDFLKEHLEKDFSNDSEAGQGEGRREVHTESGVDA